MAGAIRTSLRGLMVAALVLFGSGAARAEGGSDLPPPVIRTVPGPGVRPAVPAGSRPASGFPPATPPSPGTARPRSAAPHPGTVGPPTVRSATIPREPARPAGSRPVRPDRLPPPVIRAIRDGRPVPMPTRVPPVASTPGASRAPSGAAADANAPPLPGISLPGAPPPRPRGGVEPRPEDIVFRVERPGGVIKRFEDGPGRNVFVMTGNPRIEGFEHTRADGTVVAPLWLKANRMALWVDTKRVSELGLFGAVQGAEAEADAPAAPREDLPAWALLQEAVKGIYAEGAVELTYGDLSFRAKRVYVEPGENKALLVEPSFTGTVRREGQRDTDLPFHVRARQARIVSRGVAIFEDADAGASRASDRFEIRVKTLRVEEVEDVEDGAESQRSPDEVTLLGFRDLSSQQYQAFDAQVRAERIPIGYWPEASGGYPDGDAYPYRIRRFRYGNRTSLGRFLILGISGPIGDRSDPAARWTATVGGYTDRGPAGGGEIDWNRKWGYGKVAGWGIADYDGEDFNGFVAEETFRWMVNAESRTYLSEKWSVDAEYHRFSDAGVNLQFFENEALTHKVYESYVRPRFESGTFVGTLMAKWHEMPIQTETTELPQLQLWFTSIPIPVGGGNGPSVDISSWNRGGWLERRFATDEPFEDYGAARLQTDTRLNVAFDAGDVRISTYGGVYAANYFERTDGQPDLTRGAAIAGARANLQLNRVYPGRGGILQLDRLRHVIDLDAEFAGRWFAEDNLDQVPVFDLTDEQEERSTGIFRIRNRLQTRAREGGIRDVIDFELTGRYYVDDIGPYGIRAPGEIDYVLRGRPREKWLVAGEGRWDVGDDEFFRASFGVGAFPNPRFSVFTGIRYLRDEAIAPLVDIGWRFSEKYGIRVRDIYDFKAEENNLRLVVGRYSQDHAIFFGFTQIGRDYGFKFDFRPTFGASSESSALRFTDKPETDPWGIFE